MKKRLIPLMLLKDGAIIRSQKFSIHQYVGNPTAQVQRYNTWNIDEIMYIDISDSEDYTQQRHDHNTQIIKNKYQLVNVLSRCSFSPLAFGGGIRTIEQIKNIINNGADKIILNTILHTNIEILSQAIQIFGSQAFVACIDYKNDGYVYYNKGTIKSEYTLLDFCKKLEQYQIGEIVLQNIEKDGAANGYDIQNIKIIADHVKVPVIALSGCGTYEDMLECFQETSVDAVAAGNIFYFKEHSYPIAKKLLIKNGIDMR